MFREDKTTQMAARFLILAGGRLDRAALMGLLYIADRQILVERGTLITYDQWLWTEHGPILGATFALTDAPNQESYWPIHISQDGDVARLLADPGDDDLSRAEGAVIEQTFREWAHKDWRAVVKETHSFPEWSDSGRTSRPISYETVLTAHGFSQEDADDILENIAVQDEAFAALEAAWRGR